LDPYVSKLFVICPLVFLAGFVDAVAGGGGLISLPAYLAAGLPIPVAYGTNKFAAASGAAVSTARYLRSGKIHLKSALVSAAGALLGSYFGAKLVLFLSEQILRWCLLVLLPAAALFLLFNRGFGNTPRKEAPREKTFLLLSFIIGLVIGAYDGFFGPGTGTFLALAFTGLLGFDLLTATGNAKLVNLSSNAAALAAFLFSGNVVFSLALPAALFTILGSFLGARLAVAKGAAFIRPVLFVSLGILFVKVVADFI